MADLTEFLKKILAGTMLASEASDAVCKANAYNTNRKNKVCNLAQQANTWKTACKADA